MCSEIGSVFVFDAKFWLDIHVILESSAFWLTVALPTQGASFTNID